MIVYVLSEIPFFKSTCLPSTPKYTHTHTHRERATAHRTMRRQDKKMKELQGSIEDERKQAEAYKADVS